MTVQIIRGSCRHALGKMVQTVVSFSCVKIVSLLFKLQLLRAKEILYTEQVGQTQQFTCCLADTQQTGSRLLPADSAFLRGDLQACVLLRCSLRALSPFLRCRQVPHCSSQSSSFIFPLPSIHCYFFLVLLVQQPAVSAGCSCQLLGPMWSKVISSATFRYLHLDTYMYLMWWFLLFFRKSCVPATSLCFLRISVRYLIKREPLYLGNWVLI